MTEQLSAPEHKGKARRLEELFNEPHWGGPRAWTPFPPPHPSSLLQLGGGGGAFLLSKASWEGL